MCNKTNVILYITNQYIKYYNYVSIPNTFINTIITPFITYIEVSKYTTIITINIIILIIYNIN